MNTPVREAEGSVLVVSQFTLYGDVRRGKRPSFDAAAPPEKARALYEYFVERVRAAGLRCETGRFQEMMQVELVNDGPGYDPAGFIESFLEKRSAAGSLRLSAFQEFPARHSSCCARKICRFVRIVRSGKQNSRCPETP